MISHDACDCTYTLTCVYQIEVGVSLEADVQPVLADSSQWVWSLVYKREVSRRNNWKLRQGPYTSPYVKLTPGKEKLREITFLI